MTKTLLMLAICVVLASVTPMHSEETNEGIRTGLISQNPLERQAAYKAIIADRENVIGQLLKILRVENGDRSYQGSLHRAIDLLGKLRAKEAIESLVRIIEYVPDNFETEEMIPSQAYYVAASALVEIGQPVIPAMMAEIKNSSSTKQRNIATWVIMEIEGKNQAINRIQTAIDQGKVSQSFSAAKEYITNFQVSFGNPTDK